MKAGKTLTHKFAVSYLWNLLAKWANRFVGLISTLVLVRLLTPGDFGIVAMAMIVMHFFSTLSDAGNDKFLIKAETITPAHINSAWSLNICLRLLCCGAVAICAPLAARYFQEPQILPVLLVSCLIPVIGALRNLGLVFFERELNYRPLMTLSVWSKLLTFPVTIGLAFHLQSYWALVIGLLTAEVLYVIGSYWVHPFRPRWCTEYWREQMQFSKWYLASVTTGYIRGRIDVLLLGRYLPSQSVGTYRISQEFAWLPFTELIGPATSGLYAGLTQIKADHHSLEQHICRYMVLAYLLITPAAFGVFALQDELVLLLMGHQWQQAAPVFGLLSFLMMSMPLNAITQTVLIQLDKIRYLVCIDVIMIVLIALCFYLLFNNGVADLTVFAQYRVMLMSVFIALLGLVFVRVLKGNFLRLILIVGVPIIPSYLMSVSVVTLSTTLEMAVWLKCFLLSVMGVAIYGLIMLTVITFCRSYFPDYQFIYELLQVGSRKISKRISVF